MEQNFQTSFIPKKPLIEDRVERPASISFFTLSALFVFFTIILGSVGVYLYKISLSKNIVKMENDLNLAKNRFEPAKISQLQVLDKRLNASTEILSKHIAISPIFKSLQDITMKTIQYTKFSYELNTEKTFRVDVKMAGIAVGYRSIALQSDLFGKNKYFIDPVFSNLSLNEKGNVIFELNFSVDPSFVDFQENIKTETSANPSNSLDILNQEIMNN